MLQEMNTIQTIQCLRSRHREQPAMRRDATHHRQMVTGLEDLQDRRLSAWCIGSDSARQEIKARFIHKNKESALQTRFFFVSNQTSFRQRVISTSSRWIARSIGCWGVHFNSLSSLATCERWYATPNSNSITLRTRGQVHTAPRNPYASAPWPRKSGIKRFSSSLSSGGLPVCGRAHKLSFPFSSTLFSQRLTAPSLTSKAVVISLCFQPLPFSFIA